MGHISNPVGFRLGLSRGWLVKASSPRYNYQEDLYNQFSSLIRAFFRNRPMERKTIIYSHTCLTYNASKHFNCKAFLYDASFELSVANFYSLYLKRFRQARALRARLRRINPNIQMPHTRMTAYGFYRRRFKNIVYRFLFNRIRNRWYSIMANRINQKVSLSLRFPNCFKLSFALFSNRIITAKTIGLYAIRKLKFKNSLNSIFKPIMRYISYLFTGFRVICRGRFTRNQRATLSIFNHGSTKLSTFSSDIDYCHITIPLKYGVGSLKIWINHGFRSRGQVTNFLNIKKFYNSQL